jgi:RNA polymerase sigma-54 factor
MKPTLQLKLGQQLTLTPQLRLAIRLLQLSAVELEAEVNAAVDANPLLEREEDAEEAAAFVPGDEAAGDGASPGEHADHGEDGGDPEMAQVASAVEALDEDAPDFRWEDERPAGSGSGADGDEREDARAAPQDLHEHLAWQLHLSHLGPRDLAIGEALIEAIDEDGYLHVGFDDIRAALTLARPPADPDIEAVLHLVQRFDPVGVGARSLSECLCVQLGLLPPDTPGLALARQVAAGHLDALARHGAARLAGTLGSSVSAMDEAVALLRSLDPRPGARMAAGEPEYIVPDAIAYRQGGVWKVATQGGSQPRLGINRHYEQLIGRSSREDDSYLRAQLQEARWLIKSLESRADTLLRVARAIVRQQSGFLEHGPHAMRPLTLREVAEELGLHESTISRATTRKYLRTPRGTFEFKYFFSSGITTDAGGGASATAIQAMIRRLVDAENPRAPLSDAKLADLLKAEGVPVARRTVAKYREAMNIASSHERQRL